MLRARTDQDRHRDMNVLLNDLRLSEIPEALIKISTGKGCIFRSIEKVCTEDDAMCN